MQVKLINSAINESPRSSPLHGHPHVSDPSDGTMSRLCLNCKAMLMTKTPSLVMLPSSWIVISMLPVRLAYDTLRSLQC